MEEFAKMIYKQWSDTDEAEEFSWGDYDESWRKLYEVLNEHLATEIECSVNKKVWEIQEKSFIAGFGYACKCLSNGKIEIGGANGEK